MILVAVGTVYVAVLIARGLVGRWLAPRPHGGPDVSALQENVQRMSGELADVHQQVGDLQERVDFAERLLARQRDAERLKGAP